MPNSLYRAARFANFEIACEYSHECSPCSSPLETRLALKNKTENGEGNRDGEWNFCRGKEADIALFFQVTRILIGKVRKIFEAN